MPASRPLLKAYGSMKRRLVRGQCGWQISEDWACISGNYGAISIGDGVLLRVATRKRLRGVGRWHDPPEEVGTVQIPDVELSVECLQDRRTLATSDWLTD